jgi:hypothetical protein
MVFFSIFNIAVLYNITVSGVQLLLLLSAKEGCTTTVHQPNLQCILFVLRCCRQLYIYQHIGREFYFQSAITTDELLRSILWNFCDIVALMLENSCTMIRHKTLSRFLPSSRWNQFMDKITVVLVLTPATFSRPASYNFISTILGQC